MSPCRAIKEGFKKEMKFKYPLRFKRRAEVGNRKTLNANTMECSMA